YYHSVDENAANEVTITPEKLKEQLDYINDNNYVTITMTELYDHIENNKPIPEKSIIITFDDGYMNNYTEAFPMLKKHFQIYFYYYCFLYYHQWIRLKLSTPKPWVIKEAGL
ncbi:MAG: Polysaccharide deacetylase family protein, partial [Clostridium butyricum DORA_1]